MEPQRAPRRLFRPDQFRPSRIRVRLFLHQPTYFTIVPPRPQAQSLIAALNELEQDYLTIPNLRLFIIDPFNAFSEGQTTHHMAGALRRLQHIAEKYDVAVLLVHHFHKQLQRTVREMIYGSSMVRSISRITLAVQADPDNRRNSILTGDKCNIAREAEGLVYGIRDSEATFRGGEKKPFPTVEWLGTDDRTADELAAELFDNVKVAGKQSKQRRVDMWTEFLAERIHPGDKMRVTEIEEKAREAKLLRPKSALKDCRPADHAVMDLGIEKISESDGNGGRAVSWWVRPRDDDERVHGDGVGGTQH